MDVYIIFDEIDKNVNISVICKKFVKKKTLWN